MIARKSNLIALSYGALLIHALVIQQYSVFIFLIGFLIEFIIMLILFAIFDFKQNGLVGASFLNVVAPAFFLCLIFYGCAFASYINFDISSLDKNINVIEFSKPVVIFLLPIIIISIELIITYLIDLKYLKNKSDIDQYYQQALIQQGFLICLLGLVIMFLLSVLPASFYFIAILLIPISRILLAFIIEYKIMKV